MEISQKQKSLLKEYHILSFDVDYRGDVFMHHLCRLFQQTAHYHADNLGVGHQLLGEKQIAWVLAAMRVEMQRYPQWGESIRIRTWPSNRDRLFYYRDFVVLDAEDNIIGKAVTKWFVFSLERRRPVKTDHFAEFRFEYIETQFPGWSGKLNIPKDMKPAGQFNVEYTDLDVNRHMNNTKYIERAMGLYPLEFIDRHFLKLLEINFHNEAQYADEIRMLQSDVSEMEQYSTLVGAGDGKDVCRMRFVWDEVATD